MLPPGFRNLEMEGSEPDDSSRDHSQTPLREGSILSQSESRPEPRPEPRPLEYSSILPPLDSLRAGSHTLDSLRASSHTVASFPETRRMVAYSEGPYVGSFGRGDAELHADMAHAGAFKAKGLEASDALVLLTGPDVRPSLSKTQAVAIQYGLPVFEVQRFYTSKWIYDRAISRLELHEREVRREALWGKVQAARYRIEHKIEAPGFNLSEARDFMDSLKREDVVQRLLNRIADLERKVAE